MAENQAIVKTKKAVDTTQVLTVWDYFQKRRQDIERVLPRHISIDRLVGIMTFAIKSNPEILNASQSSLIAAVIQTVQIGLEPTSQLGHCYYIPYFNFKKGISEVQFIIGYRGLIELVNRAGKAVILTAEVVHKGDLFEYELGLEPKLKHVPFAATKDSEVVGVYCIAKNLIAQEKVFVYLNKDDIDKVRSASRAKDSPYSPWNTWYEEMAKKTAVKRICKLLPLSIDVQRQISADETTKSRIDKDMTVLPDETVWEGEQVLDVPIEANEAKIKSVGDSPAPSQDNYGEQYKKLLEKCELIKAEIGKEAYYKILAENYGGIKHANELKKLEDLETFLYDCKQYKEKKK